MRNTSASRLSIAVSALIRRFGAFAGGFYTQLSDGFKCHYRENNLINQNVLIPSFPFVWEFDFLMLSEGVNMKQ